MKHFLLTQILLVSFFISKAQQDIINADLKDIYNCYVNNQILLTFEIEDDYFDVMNQDIYIIDNFDTIHYKKDTKCMISNTLINLRLVIQQNNKLLVINNFEQFLRPDFSNYIIVRLNFKEMKNNHLCHISSNHIAPDVVTIQDIDCNPLNNLESITVHNFSILSIKEIIRLVENKND